MAEFDDEATKKPSIFTRSMCAATVPNVTQRKKVSNTVANLFTTLEQAAAECASSHVIMTCLLCMTA